MARLPRIVVPGIPVHATQRGNKRQTVFFSDHDREVYLRTLRQYAVRYRLSILGYCLMGNHTHILALPHRPDSLALALGRTHNDYARWLHVRQGTTGHLWQNRFYSCPLDDARLWTALRYVEQNPVRARLVEHAWEWPWSSARAHITGHDPWNLLDQAKWRDTYTPARWHDALLHGLTAEADAERLRQATTSGRPWGGSAFFQTLEQTLGYSLSPKPAGRKPSNPTPPTVAPPTATGPLAQNSACCRP